MKEPRLQYGYFTERMSAQDSQFLRYLEKPTGRLRQYVPGGPWYCSPGFEFISLRRWNSFSPNLGSRTSLTVGGGYFVRVWFAVGQENKNTNKSGAGAAEAGGQYFGIAIDPGYNFLENLFNEGFTIADVDIVVLTHAHPDHTENLTNLLTLVFERNNRLSKRQGGGTRANRKMVIAMTEGVFQHFSAQLKSYAASLRDIVVIAPPKTKRGGKATRAVLQVWLEKEGKLSPQVVEAPPENSQIKTTRPGTASRPAHHWIELWAGRAWHDDRTGFDSIGIIVKNVSMNSSPDSRSEDSVGILSDTKYHPMLYLDYQECKVVLAHIGSLVDEKEYVCKNGYICGHDRNRKTCPDPGKLAKCLTEKNHLYLPGFMRFLCDCLPRSNEEAKHLPLFVVSEFGEELRGGLRADFARRAVDLFKNSLPEGGRDLSVIPADVGLRIDIETRRVFCCVGHHYVDASEINALTVLPDVEAIAYVCNDCEKARQHELVRILEEWCQSARPLAVPPPEFKEAPSETGNNTL